MNRLFIIVIIVIIIILFAIIFYGPGKTYKNQLLIKYNDGLFKVVKTNVPEWAAVTPPPGTCGLTDTSRYCIYTNLNSAKLDCLNSKDCIGYWARDGTWIDHPGKTVYMPTTSSTVLTGQSVPGTFYQRT